MPNDEKLAALEECFQRLAQQQAEMADRLTALERADAELAIFVKRFEEWLIRQEAADQALAEATPSACCHSVGHSTRACRSVAEGSPGRESGDRQPGG